MVCLNFILDSGNIIEITKNGRHSFVANLVTNQLILKI